MKNKVLVFVVMALLMLATASALTVNLSQGLNPSFLNSDFSIDAQNLTSVKIQADKVIVESINVNSSSTKSPLTTGTFPIILNNLSVKTVYQFDTLSCAAAIGCNIGTLDLENNTDYLVYKAQGTYTYSLEAGSRELRGTFGNGDTQIFNETTINITAIDGLTGAPISNFDFQYSATGITYENSETIASQLDFPALQGYNYEFLFTLDNFLDFEYNLTANTSALDIEVLFFESDKLQITFRDETTRNIINSVNFTLSSDAYSEINTTTNGTFQFNNLPEAEYTLSYEAENTTQRDYIFNIPFTRSSDTNKSLYLIDDFLASDFVLTVTDRFNAPIPGVTAALLRQYVIDGNTQYEVVESMRPSVALGGSTPFTARANVVNYLFRIYDRNRNVIFQGAGQNNFNFQTLKLIDQEITIKVDEGRSPFQIDEDLYNLQYSLTNDTDQFFLSYLDTEEAYNSYKLQVYENNKLVGESNSTNSEAVISVAFTYSPNSTFRAVASVQDSETGLYFPVDSFLIDKDKTATASLFGLVGIFILLLSMIIFSIAFAGNLPTAIISNVLAIVAFSTSLLGLVEIGLATQFSLLVLGLVVIFIMREEK